MSTYSEKNVTARPAVSSRPSVAKTVSFAVHLFAVGSILYFALAGNWVGILQSLEALVLLALPALVEQIFHCHLASWLRIYLNFYCLGPLLGHSYKLFYTTVWWDKLLHCSGGVIFAIVGYYLPKLNPNNRMSPAMRVLFAICFSISISAAWEFVEFGSDMLLGMDTQNDTFISAIHSYNLGGLPGQLGIVDNITQVSVNGVPMPGYIDIGLIDTMCDMLIQTFGALTCNAALALDHGKHPAFSFG